VTPRTAAVRRAPDHVPTGQTGVRPPAPSSDLTSNGDRLLTAAEVAERWQVPTSQVYRLARDGRLPSVAIGRYRRWRLADLAEFERAGGV
jgi:excisionase family DNA binding protein